MVIWQVLNLLAPTKEMPASGIHHHVAYCTHIYTHSLLLSPVYVCACVCVCAHHTTQFLNLFGVLCTNADLKEQEFYN